MRTESSHEHDLVRIAGFDLAITPVGKFTATATTGEENCAGLELSNGAFAEIIPSDGGFRSRIDRATTSSVYDVARIELLASSPLWKVQTSLFEVDWPRGFKLRSCDYPASPSPFEFYTNNEVLLFIQNPRLIPSLLSMCAPDQKVLEIDELGRSPSILLGYRRSWSRWQQRHSILSVGNHRVVLTSQYPLAELEVAVEASRRIESTIRLIAH